MGHPGRESLRRHDVRPVPPSRQGASGQAGTWRRRADLDPVLGPRLVGYRVTYWRNGSRQTIALGRRRRFPDGRGSRRQAAGPAGGAGRVAEGRGAARERPTPSWRRATFRARRLSSSRAFGRPCSRTRTDHVFRYRVSVHVPDGRRRVLSRRVLHRETAVGMDADRGVQGRPAVPPKPARTSRDVPRVTASSLALLLVLLTVFLQEIPRGRGRRGDVARRCSRAVLGLGILSRPLSRSGRGWGAPWVRSTPGDHVRDRRIQVPLLRHPARGARLPGVVGGREHHPRAMGRTPRFVRRAPPAAIP